MSKAYQSYHCRSDDLLSPISFGGGGGGGSSRRGGGGYHRPYHTWRSVGTTRRTNINIAETRAMEHAVVLRTMKDRAQSESSTNTVSTVVGTCTYASVGGNGVQACVNSDGSISTTSCLGTPTLAGGQVCTTTTIR